MLAHNPKKRIFFNVVSLFLIAIISLFSFACDGQNDSSSNDDHITGPYMCYDATFKSYEEFSSFYNIFKKKNKLLLLTFNLDEYDLIDEKNYYFLTSAFDISLLDKENPYDYKFPDPIVFDYKFYSKDIYPPLRDENYNPFTIKCSFLNYPDFELNINDIVFSKGTKSESTGNAYCYLISCKNVDILKIEIQLLKDIESDANSVFEVLKQNMVILK